MIKKHLKDPALKPVHPGEVLSEDFLKPLAVSQYRLAKDIGVPPRRINEIAREAGIAPNSFYRHFRDVDELAVALIERAGESLRRILPEKFPDPLRVRRRAIPLNGRAACVRVHPKPRVLA